VTTIDRRGDISRSVECPTCHAAPTYACKTASGHGRSAAHEARRQIAGLPTGKPHGRWRCETCPATFSHPNALARHAKSAHSPDRKEQS
jgi:hypothetical protein